MSRLLRPALSFVAAALLSGCATLPGGTTGTTPVTGTTMALGTEPFWTLEITPTLLNFNGVDLPRVNVAHGGQRVTGDVRTISTPRITVTLRPDQCSDGMSDQTYPEAATVVVDGRTFTGCAGAPAAITAPSLERSGWRITAVNGQPAVADVEADLNFADGRISGSAGCNRLSGPYTQTRERLSFGAIAATRMACMGARGEQENRVLAIMRQPLTIRFGERMTMTWTAPDGSSIALRRLDWD